MYVIGLIGEAPHDTDCMKALMYKKYPKEEFQFVELLKRTRGSLLDEQKTKHFLRKEFEFLKPQLVLFTRDLDGILKEDVDKFRERKEYFRNFNSVVDKKGILLVHIYEIEALILNDIEAFNDYYGTQVDKFSDVTRIRDPKGVLKSLTSKYKEGENPKIFQFMEFNKALDCDYFNRFIIRFEKAIS